MNIKITFESLSFAMVNENIHFVNQSLDLNLILQDKYLNFY